MQEDGSILVLSISHISFGLNCTYPMHFAVHRNEDEKSKAREKNNERQSFSRSFELKINSSRNCNISSILCTPSAIANPNYTVQAIIIICVWLLLANGNVRFSHTNNMTVGNESPLDWNLSFVGMREKRFFFFFK